jgi:LysR family glycine cleavage system transcriptional activator
MSALIAFEAVARTKSFSKAAAELSLTQGAVSRQVQVLEEYIGATLMLRTSHGCVLTEAGKPYAEQVRQALGKIANATSTAQAGRRTTTLRLAIGPAIGSLWLMPKISEFLTTHRGIHITFMTRYVQPVNFVDEDLDAATYSGEKYDDSLGFDLLFYDNMLPVCAPRISNSYRVREPKDLLRLPLLQEAARMNAWPDWFAANGVVADHVEGQSFEHFYVVTHAALAGLGVAMLPTFAIEAELQRGDLVVAIDCPVLRGKPHYLVWPKDRGEERCLRAFRSWLLNQRPPAAPRELGSSKRHPQTI